VIKVDPPVLFPFAFPVSRGALVAIKSEEPSPSLSCHANLVDSFVRSCPRSSRNGLPNVDSDAALDAFVEDELTGNHMNQDECIDESELLGNIMNQDECIDELEPGGSNSNTATTVTIMKVEGPSVANVNILGLNRTTNGVMAASNIKQILADAKTTAGIAEAAKLVNDAKKQTAEREKAQKMAEAASIKEKKKAVALEKKSATLKKKQKKFEEKKAAQLLKVARKEKDEVSKKSNSIPPAKKHKVAASNNEKVATVKKDDIEEVESKTNDEESKNALYHSMYSEGYVASNNDKVATEKKDDIEEVESETDVEECKNALYHSMYSEGYYLREGNGGFSHVRGKKCIDCQRVVVSRRPDEQATTENVVWPSATVPVWVCAGCKGRLLCDACFQPKKAAYDQSNPGRQPRRHRK
jgi:hypothetical protein